MLARANFDLRRLRAFPLFQGFWLICLALVISMQMAVAEGRKIALVVGNEAYESLPGLKNPAADATAMSRALRDLGFEVTLLTDVGPDVFQAVLGTFGKQAETADTVLFYYSGHAFQKDGVNHLVPITARLQSTDAADSETWRLDDIAAKLKSGSGQLLVFLDACRDNALPQAVQAKLGGKGLAQFDGGAGTFVAFATAPGSVAWDGQQDGTPNSPFTHALLTHLATPGQSISDLMISVRNDVEKATEGAQTPWDQSSLRAQFYFDPATAPADAAPAFELASGGATMVSGPDGPAIVVAGVAPAKVVEQVSGVGQTRLAALDSTTRSLATANGTPSDLPRIQGVDVSQPLAPEVTVPDNLAEGVQQELTRIGCYNRSIDGSWGDNSREAMKAYYKAKGVDPGDIEPTEAVFRTLKGEAAAVCDAPAKAAAKPAAKPAKKVAKKPATSSTSQKQPAQKQPAQQTPAKKPNVVVKPGVGGGHGCKFVVVAIICS